jgi:WD40 repeat protein
MHSVPASIVALGVLVVAVSGVTCTTGVPESVTEPADAFLWKSTGRGWLIWGSGGAYVYGVSVDSDMLDVWTWRGDAMTRCGEPRRVKSTVCIVPTSESRYLTLESIVSPRQKFVLFWDTAVQAELKRWQIRDGWYCDIMRASRNGKYVALGLRDNRTTDRNFDRDEVPLGLIGVDLKDICWPATLMGRDGAASAMETAVPSDDGRYIAVAGWDNGAAVVDVVQQRLLWASRPPHEASLVDIAFSPDNKVVYTGGTAGCVYGMEVASGRVLSQWFTTASGKPVYGHRISTVAVSPDGRYVAAGTGPTGLVCLWDARNGNRIGTFNHGGTTILILTFSPDSKRLASVAGGWIKVWRTDG